jgi:hypothetical protein
VRLDIVIQNLRELGDDLVAFERREETAVHVHRGFGFFEGSWQGDTEVRVLGFSRAVLLSTRGSGLGPRHALYGFLKPLNGIRIGSHQGY